MTTNPKADAALALHRFGFGPQHDSIAAIADDPRGALLADLDQPGAGRVTAGHLPDSGQAAREVFDFRAEQQAKQKLAQRAKREAEQRVAMGMADDGATMQQPAEAPPGPNVPNIPREIFLAEAKVRAETAIGSQIGFVERLVWFWSNHFCVSADKIISMAGAYEREAIRPYVLSRFGDMLAAVESHPCMLFYLDNSESIGPNSIAGLNRDKGLNENLAREILELHTLGVRSGYSQTDVTSFAKILTGWTWVPIAGNPDHGGEFVFNKRMHEPGPQTVLGKTYSDSGIEQGRAVLADLARHPATAQHVAAKLARHFVSDQPPQSLIDKLAASYRDTDGNLKEVAKALINAPEAWTAERTKLKRPSEWVMSSLRLTGFTPQIGRIAQVQNLLGEPLWRPPAPNGFSDLSSDWLDGLAGRVDIVNEVANRIVATVDPVALIDNGLGPLASQQTRQTIARAESRQQALALLLMAPEFLRR